MSSLKQQVKRARNREWFNIWLDLSCKVTAVAALVAAVVYKVCQVVSVALPLWQILFAAVGLSLIISLVWSRMRIPSERQAAAMLDEAAGLRERVSSSLYLTQTDDPFARAVQDDAEARVSSLSVSRHLGIRRPGSLPSACAAVFVSLLLLMIPAHWLRGAEAKVQRQRTVQVNQTKARVKERLASFKKEAQTNPAMSELAADLEKLDAIPAEKMREPRSIRHEALKKIDKLADAVRQKRDSERFDKASEFKKMMRRIKHPDGDKGDVQKLTKQLASGDFKSAKETVRKIQEQLATLKQNSDKKFAKQMQKQLEDLAKQIEKAGDQKQLKKALEQAGIKKEDVKRMLERLTKEDIDQVKKQLEKQGMSQQQIQKMAQQMQQQQGAQQMAQKMSQAMQNAAKSAGDMQTGEAMSSLEAAADQLSELEMMEQEKNQLESALSQLDDLKDQMNENCSKCNGTGQKNGKPCGGCNGTGMGDGSGQGGNRPGGGQGQLGQGRGGLAQKEETGINFKIQRQKVKTTKGRIIGQFLVDGEQVRGEVGEEVVEVVAAAERDATDAINRDRVPRQYQKAVKEYFSRLPGGGQIPADDDDGAKDQAPEQDQEQPSTDDQP